MRSAVERYTRKKIDPGDALRGRGRYVCGCCEAPVHLVQAFTAHFAHDKYQARPDCENYFWSEYQYTGRPSRIGATRELDPDEISYLAFEVTLDGPRLVVFVPPAKSDTCGSIELISRTTRRIPVAHLSRGIRLSFPLRDSTWVLRTTEEVSEEYSARLLLGRYSLEPERNLFSASNGIGRHIPERAAVMLGESLWWIGRTDIRDEQIPPGVGVEYVVDDHGWYVFLVTLPEDANEIAAAQLTRWLQRRIQPRRARLWIESPFPRGRREDGVSIYAMPDGPLTFGADQSVSLQVFASTGESLFEAENVIAATLAEEALGDLLICADGVRVARVERRIEVPKPASSVVVQFADGLETDLVNLQGHIEGARKAGAPGLAALLRWNPLSLRPHLKHCRALGLTTAIEAEVRLVQGSTIEFDKLGCASWPTDDVPLKQIIATDLPQRDLFRWLASVGATTKYGSRRLTLCPRQALKIRFPELRRLAQLTWPVEFAAQVRTAARVLEGIG